jgi:hypothetical protein
VLNVPVVERNEVFPMAVLDPPVVAKVIAPVPMATLFDAVVAPQRAPFPMATLLLPKVLQRSAK